MGRALPFADLIAAQDRKRIAPQIRQARRRRKRQHRDRASADPPADSTGNRSAPQAAADRGGRTSTARGTGCSQRPADPQRQIDRPERRRRDRPRIRLGRPFGTGFALRPGLIAAQDRRRIAPRIRIERRDYATAPQFGALCGRVGLLGCAIAENG